MYMRYKHRRTDVFINQTLQRERKGNGSVFGCYDISCILNMN